MQDPPDLQRPFDVAVAILTIFRPTLLQAIRSIYAQQEAGRIQVVLGVDKGRDDSGMLDTLRAECPAHCALTVIDPGYSTAQRNGGLYSTAAGGALRTACSYLANSRFVAYLDDDNWWTPRHLATLLRAIEGKSYAFSRRVLYDKQREEVICRDEWESVGPGKGVYDKGFGGWVDTSCLMVDKLACHDVLPAWAMTKFDNGVGEDRMVFERLKGRLHGDTGEYTAFYRLALDGVHPYLLWKYKQAGVDLARYLSPERMPPDSVWDECARHDAAEASARAAQAAAPGGPAPAPAVRPSAYASTQYTLNPKR